MAEVPTWDRIEEIFDRALERPGDERGAFVKTACGGDAALRRRVERLLESAAGLDGFLERPVLEEASGALEGLAATIGEAAALDLSGRRVGPYELLRRLGRGGMGVVYLARRADRQFDMEAAIKLLPPGAASRRAIERLRVERQILAQLEHPSIARLIDGGITDEGLPYLAMEYVEGVPIGRYCRDRDLSLAARLDLVMEVARAVDHAHRRLVVHRDLKPDNILVGASGRPKLLDFGIAKLVEGPAAGLTATALRPMTPGYASPEQLNGRPVGTASDIFSLGVLLYEILTGSHPFRQEGDTALAVGRAVAEREPPPPSEVVRAEASSAADPSERRRLERRWRRLRGDLDTIVLKALRKEPDRRYHTAAELAEDLRSHLRGLPIRARRPTWRYRAGKFVRRHRAAVAASILVLLSLVGGLLGTLWQARQARRERDLARTEALKAERTAEFLAGLFRDADPNLTGGRELSARELLERGAERLDGQQPEDGLADEPGVRADLLYAIGVAEGDLGLLDRSERHLRKVVATRRRLPGEGRPELAEALLELGATQLARGDYEAARESYGEALEIRRAITEADGLGLAGPLYGLGQVEQKTGDLAAAFDRHAEALRIRRLHLEPPHPDLARSLHSLASTQIDPARREEAVGLFEEAIEMWQALGRRHLFELASAENDLGVFLHGAGRLEEAESLYRSSLEAVRGLYGNDHPDLADHMTNVGKALIDLGRFGEAEPFVRRAVEITRRHRGPSHFDRIGAEVNLGTLQMGLGEFAAAAATYAEAANSFEELLGAEHPYTGMILGYLGRAQLLAGEPGVAATTLARARRILERSSFAADGRSTVPVLALACLRRDTGDPEQALPLLRQVLATRRSGYPADSWGVAEAEIELGVTLRLLGRSDEARELLVAGHDKLLASRGPEDWMTRRAERYVSALPEAAGQVLGAAGR